MEKTDSNDRKAKKTMTFLYFGLAALSYHNPCNTQTGKDLYFCLSYLSANVYFSFITVERMKTYFLA